MHVRYYRVDLPCGDSFRIAERHIITHRTQEFCKDVTEDLYEEEFNFRQKEGKERPEVIREWITSKYPVEELKRLGTLLPQGKDVDWQWEVKNANVEVLEL